MDFVIKKGLDLPITGATTDDTVTPLMTSQVAVLGSDYIGMKPTMQVKVGDHVKVGQELFACKKNVGLIFTSPASGTVRAINRGEKRVFQSLVIDTDQDQQHVTFDAHKGENLNLYSSTELRQLLISSGMWTSIRQRPFDKVADVNAQVSSIFVTAVDTHPLAPDPSIAIKRNEQAFDLGLLMLAKLTTDKVYVCVGGQSKVHTPKHDNIQRARFEGPHPAGNVGTHIHMLAPAHNGAPVWHIGYQDVIALGHLLTTGKLFTERLISIAGPKASKPQHVLTRKGAQISSLLADQNLSNVRVVSGSVLHGHHAKDTFNYLGHYHNQISLIEEDTYRELLGWHSPGLNKFSIKNIFVSKLLPNKKFNLTTTTHGSLRAMVPVGSFEAVTPLDILPTQLLRALVSKDTDTAQELGCLELAEEDMGLYTFASPGKVDFGPILRETLNQIEREG